MDCGPRNRTTIDLFGGCRSWEPCDWTASDDRVRGGKSQSYLESVDHAKSARFNGNLDIKALGGAGFASQRTIGDDKVWDLSKYDGIQINVAKTDGKTYTLILKDNLVEKREDGREQATTSWEYDFTVPTSSETQIARQKTINIPWSSFKPTYRGREQKDAKPLRTSNVKRFSIMMRSFFGDQHGDFSITVNSISAYGTAEKHAFTTEEDVEKAGKTAKGHTRAITSQKWRKVAILALASGLTLVALHTLYRRLAL